VALDFGAYLAPKCTADLHHHVVHCVNFVSVDIKNAALLIGIVYEPWVDQSAKLNSAFFIG